MGYKIFYKSSVEKDIKSMDKQEQSRIIKKLEEALSRNPKRGKKLAGKFKDLYSYRIGDYRIVYNLIPKGVLILRIAHKREVYKKK